MTAPHLGSKFNENNLVIKVKLPISFDVRSNSVRPQSVDGCGFVYEMYTRNRVTNSRLLCQLELYEKPCLMFENITTVGSSRGLW